MDNKEIPTGLLNLSYEIDQAFNKKFKPLITKVVIEKSQKSGLDVVVTLRKPEGEEKILISSWFESGAPFSSFDFILSLFKEFNDTVTKELVERGIASMK
jgi:hypothetical protein